ncbi:MAG: YraN family protein [Butyrivibrio sp.]|nr:YraN family protein [Muribaculum sp.]MCM1552920.1 YraN family protein [Butyrivibrio sp.]
MEADKNKRQLGADKEQLAAEYLTARGMDILERNFRNRQGEIDIIGRHGQYLVFVEVKFRSGTDMGMAVEAVGIHKQRQICKVADYYRMLHHLGDNTAVRYDVLAIQGEEIQWIQNAFPHIYRRR